MESFVQTVVHRCGGEGDCHQLRIRSVCFHLEGHQKMNFLEEVDGFLNSERYDLTVFIHLWM